jgi:hypothetical protein
MAPLNPAPLDESQRRSALFRLAIALSLALFVLRVTLATSTGFGDSEALYASYALFPQPAYLDHPGLVGLVARWVGGGHAPEPFRAHLVTTALAALVPWLGALGARLAGSNAIGAAGTVLALALVPEFAVGLYGLTPDLFLCLTLLGALTAASAALRAEPRSFRALVATLLTGGLVGLATLSKVTGGLFGLSFLVALFSARDRRRLRTVAPWAALGIALVLVSPLVVWEARQDWPMLRHRLVTTQTAAGFSLRNLGALVGGQLVYLSPFYAWGAWVLGRDLWRRRREDEVTWMLWLATVIPGSVLVVLCLWSRVAEPHWLAPALLPLGLHLGRSSAVSSRLAQWALGTGAALTLLVWALVKTPLGTRWPESLYNPRYDLTNDLYVWGPAKRLLEDAVEQASMDSHTLPVVVGPHWTVCAQAQVVVGRRVRVGCNSPLRDDFDRWFPRKEWLRAKTLLFVTDDRFAVDPSRELPERKVAAISRVGIRRGGRLVRTVQITRLDKTGEVARLRR